MGTINKIFGIGFHKTGTKTLQGSLEILGYRVCGPRQDLLPLVKQGRYRGVFDVVERYDAFQDNPWPMLYKILDLEYPGSKFILTVRDEEKWIKSVVNYFGDKETSMRKWIYGLGSPKGNEELYINTFKKHNSDVKRYFLNRPDDLLVIDLTAGEGWEMLCSFLEKNQPREPFPHFNKGKY